MTVQPHVDRSARAQLSRALQDYMNDHITNDELDDIIWEVSRKTNDELARMAVRTIWCTYDDIRTHHVESSREEWDGLQRLRLLLDSDVAHVPHNKTPWTPRRWALSPFASLTELMAVRKSVPNFVKQPYRPELRGRRSQNLKRYSRAALWQLLLFAIAAALLFALVSLVKH